MTRVFLTTTIPYVNAPPHLGFALEAVQADALARYHRRRGTSPDPEPIGHQTAARVGEALAGYDIRRACEAVQDIVDEANRYVERVRPWELARSGGTRRLDAALATLVSACRTLGTELAPFLPGATAAVTAACAAGPDGRLPAPRPLFPVLRTDPAGSVR